MNHSREDTNIEYLSHMKAIKIVKLWLKIKRMNEVVAKPFESLLSRY